MILSKIKEFYTSHKKTIFYAFVFWFIVLNSWDVAFAEDSKEDGIIKAVDYFLAIVSTLLWTLTWLISLLLNPGWVNWTIFWFETYLKDMWIMISNIVYFIFAFVLITIAFMNIIGKWQDVWEMRQALPKFVIWVLMVPFSWFFVQFILSISAMLTVAVLWLPYETMQGKDAFKSFSTKNICDTYVLDLNASWDTKNTVGAWTDSAVKAECTKNWGKMQPISDILSGKTVEWTAWAVYWIMNIYTYQIMKIDQVRKLFDDQITAKEGIKTFTSLAIKVIFDLLFIVVFLILMVALFMALFARWTWLWIYAMFSPVFGLLFFFGKARDWVWEQKFWVWEFIKLALVPVYVSAALAFWLIFIFVASNWLEAKTWDWKSIFWVIEDSEWNKNPSLDVWGFKLVVKGEHADSKWPDKIWVDSEDLVEALQWWLWKIILQLFWLAMLWIALMAALKSSEITGKVVQPIADFGKSVWSLVAKSPQYAPIIPTWKWWMSAAWLQSFWGSIEQKFRWDAQTKGNKFADSMFGDPTELKNSLREFNAKFVPNLANDTNKTHINEVLMDLKLAKSQDSFDAAVNALISKGVLNKEAVKKDGKIIYWNKGDNNLLWMSIHNSMTSDFKKLYGTNADEVKKVLWKTSTGKIWESTPASSGEQVAPVTPATWAIAPVSMMLNWENKSYNISVTSTWFKLDGEWDWSDFNLNNVIKDWEIIDKTKLETMLKSNGSKEWELKDIIGVLEKKLKEKIEKK